MGTRILAVDDLIDELELVTTIVRRRYPDCEIFTAENGTNALRLAHELHPDIILLDAKMPDLSGFEVCRRLKADPQTKSIPVLMVSGVMVGSHARVEGLESGADGYICKPFESDELLAQVGALLRLKQYADLLQTHQQELENELNRRTATLKESETRFRSVFENSPDAIFVEDVHGNVLSANPASGRLHGLTPDQMIGRNVLDLVPPATREAVKRDFPRWANGELTYYEGSSLSSDGRSIPVEIRGSSIEYNGHPAVLLQVRDVSKRKRIENVMRELAQGLSTTTGLPFFYALVQNLAQSLNASYAVISELDATCPDRIQTVAVYNRGEIADNYTYPVAGTPCGSVLGRKVCCYPDHVQESFPGYQLLADLQIQGYIGAPLLNADGHPIGLIAVMYAEPIPDVEFAQSLLQIFAARAAAELERTKAVQELWESQERYRSLTDDVLDTSSVGIFILDADFRVVWMNQALEQYFGLRRDETMGSDMRQLVHERIKNVFDNPEYYAAQVSRSYQQLTYIDSLICHVQPGDDRRERWLEHRSQPIKSGLYAGGRIEHFIDITDRRNLHDQLLQAQKMESIGRLAGGIAHDFNNLLTSILGFSRLIQDEIKEDSPIREDVQEIIHAGERASKLTRQLLAFSRRQVVQARPLDLNQVVVDMVQLLRRTLGEDIELVTILGEDLGMVEADTSQLEQVIMNLAVNSRDAMPNGGKLTIRTSALRLDKEDCRGQLGPPPGPYIMLSIQDTGCGMTEEVRARAFEPFFTTKEVGKGTGLGLSTVYGIITQFSGQIEINSTLNVGTEIRIYLPQVGKEFTCSPETDEKPMPGGNETILVVEDEDTVRHLTVRILRSLGYHVLQARLGSEALDTARRTRQPIHLLLTDVVMPHMSGPRLAQEIVRQCPDIKMLFISGFTQDAITDHGMQKNHIRLLPKPYTRELLAQTVREVLDAPLEAVSASLAPQQST